MEKLTRKQKLKLNNYASLTNQLVSVISAFVLPRLILGFYGSELNGLVSSITQFISFISMVELGVGAVVQTALFKPLAEKNYTQISRVLTSANKFFKLICKIFIGYVIILLIFIPMKFIDSFDYLYTASLVLILSISSFAQYYFGLVNTILLSADQKSFIDLFLNIIITILNIFVSIVLINYFHSSIQVFKLVTVLIYLIKPILLYLYVKKHYNINLKEQYDEEPIKQKWNGLAQHIAFIITSNTDVVVLTFFSTLSNISVYTVYSLVTNGLKNLAYSFSIGYQSMFGNILAKNEISVLNKEFSEIEWKMHTLVSWLFGTAATLIVPFVSVYTANIHDANYINYYFGYVMVLAQGLYCLRLPYNTIILSAGHYKETQNSSIIEAIINVVLSLILVKKFGLVGVACGTAAAMLYKTIYLVFYLKNNILLRNPKIFIKHIIVDLIMIAGIFLYANLFKLESVSYISWIILAIKVSIGTIIIVIVVNMIFYPEKFKKIKNKLFAK